MTIQVLVLRTDGTQRMEQREVPDDFYEWEATTPAEVSAQ